jgi:hypothetical protein
MDGHQHEKKKKMARPIAAVLVLSLRAGSFNNLTCGTKS